MRDPHQRSARLIAALEDLIGQEATALRGREFSVVAELQERAGSLLAALATEAPGLTDLALQNRLRAVQARRAESSAMLEEALDFAREALRETNLARGRAAQIAPVYGFASGAPRRSLSFVG